tara:strand:- start:601 stop:2232 length:1632 start_codon:yes stop_codon:yes gene_type:complete
MLDAMIEVEPPPPWLVHQHVFSFCLDQCNIWQASKDSRRGHFRGSERLNREGMPVTIRSTTVCNAVQLKIPMTLGMLTPAEVATIREKGPYTEDYRLMLHPLEPACVKQQLDLGFDEMLQPLRELAGEELNEETIVRALHERPPPPVNGRSEMDFLPTIPDCDTKAFKDVFRFHPILLARCALTMLVMVVTGDGQLVEILRACKVRWPSQFKHILIGNGYFHSFVHFLFALHQGFWKCCLATFACWLHKDKQIYEHFKDLTHDNAKHCIDFHRVVSAACTAFLLLDVQHPSPATLLSDPSLYAAQVQHDSGTVILELLRHVEAPAIRYKKAIRTRRGSVLRHLVAYSIHVHRSVAHKPKEVLIMLTTLAGLCCAHPKLQMVLEFSFAVSLLGHIFSAFDHLLETINNLQLKRSTAFRGYDSQLHFTEYLKPLLHVDACWKLADAGVDLCDDGIPVYLYNDVAELRRKLVEIVGTDLTVKSGNVLWFTGNAVSIYLDDYRERMPWVWIWEVAFGRSAGLGRPAKRATTWRRYTMRFIERFLFHC